MRFLINPYFLSAALLLLGVAADTIGITILALMSFSYHLGAGVQAHKQDHENIENNRVK